MRKREFYILFVKISFIVYATFIKHLCATSSQDDSILQLGTKCYYTKPDKEDTRKDEKSGFF